MPEVGQRMEQLPSTAWSRGWLFAGVDARSRLSKLFPKKETPPERGFQNNAC